MLDWFLGHWVILSGPIGEGYWPAKGKRGGKQISGIRLGACFKFGISSSGGNLHFLSEAALDLGLMTLWRCYNPIYAELSKDLV